jgi:hypothetical protein
MNEVTIQLKKAKKKRHGKNEPCRTPRLLLSWWITTAAGSSPPRPRIQGD